MGRPRAASFIVHEKGAFAPAKTPNMSIIPPISDKVKRKTFAKTIAKVAFTVYNKGASEEMTKPPESGSKAKGVSPMNDEQKLEQGGIESGMNEDVIMDTEEDIIEMTDEDGNVTLFHIVDYFFYNGEEYAILTDSNDDDTTEAVDCYVMKIVPTTDEDGEELEEFVPVEDQKLEARLMEIATTKLNDDEEADDED